MTGPSRQAALGPKIETLPKRRSVQQASLSDSTNAFERIRAIRWPWVAQQARRGLTNVVLLAFSVVALLPLAWMVSTSLKATGAEYDWPPRWIPEPIVLGNYIYAHTVMNFAIYYRNTITIAVLTTLGAVLTSTMAGYAFARIRFFGREVLFVVLLATMMLPSIVTLIPTYIIFRNFGWINTLLPLIVPSMLGGSALNIFLARQFFMSIPKELEDAARIDGAGTFRIYAQIMLPLCGPLMAVIAIFTFLQHWTEFMGPLIYLNSDDMRTVALGIALNKGLFKVQLNYLMAASTVMTIPVVILFFAAQRYFMKGIVLTGLTGR
jgi:ABC-type glycerol-3-phosphate transport system permease component